jgi:hypothetical protein
MHPIKSYPWPQVAQQEAVIQINSTTKLVERRVEIEQG